LIVVGNAQQRGAQICLSLSSSTTRDNAIEKTIGFKKNIDGFPFHLEQISKQNLFQYDEAYYPSSRCNRTWC
jgi:hypothetical protein